MWLLCPHSSHTGRAYLIPIRSLFQKPHHQRSILWAFSGIYDPNIRNIDPSKELKAYRPVATSQKKRINRKLRLVYEKFGSFGWGAIYSQHNMMLFIILFYRRYFKRSFASPFEIKLFWDVFEDYFTKRYLILLPYKIDGKL